VINKIINFAIIPTTTQALTTSHCLARLIKPNVERRT